MVDREAAYFLDTSALLKIVWNEEGSEVVRDLCDSAPEGHVVTSYLALAEALNRAKKVWLTEIKGASDGTEEKEVLKRYASTLEKLLFPSYFPHAFTTLPLSFSDRGALWSAVRELEEKGTLDAVDLLHVYFLVTGDVQNSIGAKRTILVSSDRELVEYCRGEGITVLDPRE